MSPSLVINRAWLKCENSNDLLITITNSFQGVYVNQTRSTHHEGFCSIAGMQYRISSTSHTQTAATAVATELHDQVRV